VSEPLPLAAAQRRLGRPGRPRLSDQERARREAARAARRVAVPVRLFDVDGAARYLGVSPDTVRSLYASGVLPRVRIPLPHGGELRRALYDRSDLDRLVEAWKER
jgi:hypothetical protein